MDREGIRYRIEVSKERYVDENLAWGNCISRYGEWNYLAICLGSFALEPKYFGPMTCGELADGIGGIEKISPLNYVLVDADIERGVLIRDGRRVQKDTLSPEEIVDIDIRIRNEIERIQSAAKR